MLKIYELLHTGVGTEGSLLIPKTIYDSIIEAVEANRIGREKAALYFGPNQINGSSIDVDLEDDGTSSLVITRIAEGANVPFSAVTFSSTNMKPVKYGTRIAITKEMLEDGKWNLLDYNVEKTGREFAYNEDALIIAVLDTAANTVSGGTAVTVANITRAMQYLEANKYTSTDLLVGVEVANDLRNIDTFVEADKLGSRETFDRGLVGKIYAMNVWLVNSPGMTATTAYVIDRKNAFMVAEKRPVTMQNYDDVPFDITGATVTQRIAIAAMRTKAICNITSS